MSSSVLVYNINVPFITEIKLPPSALREMRKLEEVLRRRCGTSLPRLALGKWLFTFRSRRSPASRGGVIYFDVEKNYGGVNNDNAGVCIYVYREKCLLKKCNGGCKHGQSCRA